LLPVLVVEQNNGGLTRVENISGEVREKFESVFRKPDALFLDTTKMRIKCALCTSVNIRKE